MSTSWKVHPLSKLWFSDGGVNLWHPYNTGLVTAYRVLLRADFSVRHQSGGAGGAGSVSFDTVKCLRAKAVKAVVSCLEGRTDTRVHDEIYSKLETQDLKVRRCRLNTSS